MLMPIVKASAMIIVAIHKLIFYLHFKTNNPQSTSNKDCATDNTYTVLFIKADGKGGEGQIRQPTFCYIGVRLKIINFCFHKFSLRPF